MRFVDRENIQPKVSVERRTSMFDKIREWSNERNITRGATKHAQITKLMEEMGEMSSAITRGSVDQIKDEIGDCVVVLTIIAAQHDLSIEDCIKVAYNKIKDRKGKIVNGIYIKEQDLA